ncbi:MAG: UDP-glucose/GDP-mannose dehydrogenase family protein [Pseudomonadota bacterium]|nr:UDP-glucose/GDP-mannose dehydrogenase family protein [Pseudomonadota bacterium]
MKISVIGCGYVGLVSGVCFADSGHTVTCIDNDNKKIQLLKDNQVPIYEPGLNELLLKNIKGNNLHFDLNINENIKDSEIVLITVGTPTDENGEADLTFVRQCANEIAEFISPNTLVIVKSTVPVGTCDEIESIIYEKCVHSEFSVISNPEFLREGNAIYDFMNPDRIVIGIKDQNHKKRIIDLYTNISNEDKILFTSRRSSELIKYASNSMLAMRIIFINEIADLCEKIGADVTDIAKGIGLDKRIGPHFLEPGPGFGGSCFPKDARALIESGKKFDAPQTLLESVILGNDNRKKNISKKILDKLDEQSENQIGILGVTFKAETDDMREAPSLIIIPDLQDNGMNVSVYDPEGEEEASKLIENVNWKQTAYEAAEDVDCLVILTDWKEFKDLDLIKLKDKMKRPLIYDFRNIFDPDKMAELGFEYFSLGRG